MLKLYVFGKSTLKTLAVLLSGVNESRPKWIHYYEVSYLAICLNYKTLCAVKYFWPCLAM